MRNILGDMPSRLDKELTETLFGGESFRVERIVSKGHASPPGFWYDQKENEWVLLLSGSTVIEYEGAESDVTLRVGDHLDIPAGVRHRVRMTDPDEPTVWLAIFYSA